MPDDQANQPYHAYSGGAADGPVSHRTRAGGLELGGDDYIVKPFNPQLLYAKVWTIIQNRLKLRTYYQGQIRLEPATVTISDADRLFLETAMHIVEANLTEPTFSVPLLVREMGVSQSSFYRRIKSITGQSVVEFIRDVRLK